MDYKIIEVEQGSTEWLDWRKGGFGASDAPLFLNGKHFDRTFASMLTHLVEGTEPPAPKNQYIMQKGKDFEPIARRWYENRFNVQAPPLCAQSLPYPFIRASLDGWLPSPRVIVEIKFAGRVDHDMALERIVTPKYTPQLLHQCLVMGSPRVHYVSGNPNYEPAQRVTMAPFRGERPALLTLLTRLCVAWEAVSHKTILTFEQLCSQSQEREGEFPLPPSLLAL